MARIRPNFVSAIRRMAAATAALSLAGYVASCVAADPTPGSLDTTPFPGFAAGNGKINNLAIGSNGGDFVRALAVQPDGKLVLVGDCRDASGQPHFCIARLTGDGSLDTSFSGPGGTSGGRVLLPALANDDRATSVAVQADGKLLLAGTCWDGINGYQMCVTRLNSDGSIDATFVGPSGSGAGRALLTSFTGNSRSSALLVQPDGRIVVLGQCPNGAYSQACVARLHGDGRLDPTFTGPNGTAAGLVTLPIGQYDFDAAGLVRQPDGKLLLTGSCVVNTQRGLCAARLLTNGSVDSSFAGPNVIAPGRVGIEIGNNEANAYAAALQADGKLLIAGRAVTGAGKSDFALVRLNQDGSPDAALEGPAGGAAGVMTLTMGLYYDYGLAMAVQADGRIVLVGQCSLADLNFCIARLLPDGSLDPSFDGPSGYGNGRVNLSLSTSGTQGDWANAVAIQADGKIVVAGYCDIAAGGTAGCVARLHGGPYGGRDCSMDVDGDGRVLATTDALIVTRVALGMTGNAVLQGVPVAGRRVTWPAIRDYLVSQCGMSISP